MTRADLEITLEPDGSFSSARPVDQSEPKIFIPATEASAGRSGKKPKNHPLCDYISYIAPYNVEKHLPYVEDLSAWTTSPCSHPMLQPILTYVQGGTILADLAKAALSSWMEPAFPQTKSSWSAGGFTASGRHWTGAGNSPPWSKPSRIGTPADWLSEAGPCA